MGFSGAVRHVLVSMRPHQWVKNVFVLAPLVFALKALDSVSVVTAVVAAILFSLASGVVYLFNDVRDAGQDALHPVKRRRPVAAGLLSQGTALGAAAVIGVVAVLGAFVMNWRTGLVLAAFLVLNSIYSLWAKNIAMIDVLFISGSFVLRVMGGATAISVPISIWILSCTFALACYLGLGKRVHELRTIGADASTVRKALGGYQLGPAQVGLVVAGLASTLLYGAYSLSAHAVENFHTSSLIWTVPFAALGLARFGWITMRSRSDRSPTETLVTDPLVLLSVAAWSILSVGVVYWGWL